MSNLGVFPMYKDISMVKKGLDASVLLENSNTFVQFYAYLVELRNLYRQGWVRRHGLDKEKAESDGDHTFSVAIFALLVAKELRPDLDAIHVVLILLIHEIVEAITGDPIHADEVPKEEKTAAERIAIHEIFDSFQSGQFFIDLWEEYVAQETPAAIFAKDWNLLDGVLMATVYDKNGLNKGSKDEFWYHAIENVKTPEAKYILNAIK